MATETITISTADIRDAWIKIQKSAPYLSDIGRQSTFEREAMVSKWRGSRYDEWVGCSGEQMQGRLVEGYRPKDGETPDVNFSAAPIHKRRFMANDEAGELQVDAVLAGDDYIYRAYTPREVPRNINIVVDTCFSASTGEKVIAEYLEWVLRLIDALQQRGLAPGLELSIALTGCFRTDKGRKDIRIPLVQAGEEIDPTAWRAYFSPGAFRTLGFLGIGIAADRAKQAVGFGLGMPDLHNEFRAEFDDETSTLYIVSPNSPHRFDSAVMNKLVEDAGILGKAKASV